MAMQSLGRAIHYLQDIGCTPHSTGMTVVGKNCDHNRFENYLDANFDSLIYDVHEQYIAEQSTNPHDQGKYEIYMSSYSEICNDLAAYSSSFKDSLNLDQQNIEYRQAAIYDVYQTLSYITGLLYKFYYDVEVKSSSHEIKNGSTYFIKNVDKGKYLDIEGANSSHVNLSVFDESPNQQFIIEYDNGAFQICSVAYPNEKLTYEIIYDYKDGFIVPFNTNLIHSPTSTGKFKITYDGNSYRIASQININTNDLESKYDYTHYLSYDGYSSPLEFSTSNLTDPDILWEFIEVVEHNDYMVSYISKNERKILSYSPTTTGYQFFSVVSNNDVSISVFD